MFKTYSRRSTLGSFVFLAWIIGPNILVAAQSSTAQSTTSVSSTVDSSNYGALTTVFTPPATCFYPTYVTGYLLYIGWAQTKYPSVDNNPATDCYPSNFGWELIPGAETYFSPGLCPSGYSSTKVTTVGEETRATCCPSGFSVKGIGLVLCYSVYIVSSSGFPISAIITPATGVGIGPGGYQYMLLSTSTRFIDLILHDTVTVTASGISIRWRAGDFPMQSIFPPNPSDTSFIPEANGSNSTLNATVAASGTKGGLSQGAKIGIGVGVPLFLLAMLGCIGACILRRRARARQQNVHEELDGKPVVKHELDTRPGGLNQLDAVELPADLPEAPRPPPPDIFEAPSNVLGISPTETTTKDSVPAEATGYSETEAAASPSGAGASEVSPVVATPAGSPPESTLAATGPVSPVSPTDDAELAWLEAEEARLRERRSMLQDLQRLREEEHKVAEEEAAIRARIRLKRNQS